MAILVLAGSGEYTPALEPVDRFLLSKIAGAKTVALLPTAAGQEDDASKWIKMGETYFRKLGAMPVGLEVYNAAHTGNEKLWDKIRDANLVYISGGDPGYLLLALKGSKLWETLESHHNHGAILAGSSAGAMALGNWTFANPYQSLDSGQQTPRWEPGLGMVNFAVLPHFDYMQKHLAGQLEALWQATPQQIQERWVGIDEDTVLVVEDSRAQVMGKGQVEVHFGPGHQRYGAGESFRI